MFNYLDRCTECGSIRWANDTEATEWLLWPDNEEAALRAHLYTHKGK